MSGPSRFVVADEPAAREEARQRLATTGKRSLDLMQAYPEEAVPHWQTFRRWKDDVLARHMGLARHREQYYDAMMELMGTGLACNGQRITVAFQTQS